MSVSIVVPALNEAANIPVLVKRLQAACQRSPLIASFEVIIVDDHSTDGTLEVCQRLAQRHTWLKVLQNQGQPGKAFSLLEGFRAARYELVGMIDADLQYPPEALPAMIAKIYDDGADVVIANRVHHKTSLRRRIVSKLFRSLSGLLHGQPYDMQSGLKLLRRDILTYCDLKPTRWTLDLELMSYAQALGCRIDSVDIDFAERVSGQSKIQLVRASYEILKQSLKLRFHPRTPTHPLVRS